MVWASLSHNRAFLRCTCLDVSIPGSTQSEGGFRSPPSEGTLIDASPRCLMTIAEALSLKVYKENNRTNTKEMRAC